MNWLKLKNHLDKYLPVYVTLAMIAGFYVGNHFDVKKYEGTLKNLNMLVVISMIYPMMINLNLSGLKNSAKLGKQLAIALTMGLIISPLIMYSAIWLTELFHPLDHQLALGLLLATVVPCSSMSIAYTGLSRGNIELATIVVALSFTLAIVTVPGWLKIFASSYHVSISVWLLIKTILTVVITPMILGVLTRVYLMRKLGPEGFLRIKPAFPAISLLGMYTIVFLIFMEKAKLIASKPGIVGLALIPLVLYYAIALLFMTFVDKAAGIPYKDHMAVTFTSVGKNEGTAMAIALAAGTGLMAIAPALTPIAQIPFLVSYVKAWRKIAGMWKCKIKDEEAVSE
ncbi:arsenic resistance protein [Thermococcus waiotapuensis]|uniref:Arsenic resistance protein n=1 Tax=Thermococcus waiotapuensis TaxID=90909 RepID=A0AAE4T1V5_9EURY|nr:arsenic resistance protein [Thermococcus waiotapuensis]MDV3103507.1 arsenic resistance protein [Thermococcus waiotapuensis]